MADSQVELAEDKGAAQATEAQTEEIDATEQQTDAIPAYVFPYNQEARNVLMKELNFSPEMMNVFNKLCVYISQPSNNSPIVDLNDFLIFSSGREDMKGLQKQNFLSPLYSLIKIVLKEDAGIVEVLSSDDRDNPDRIILKERKSEVSQLYRYVSSYFEESYKKFLAKTNMLLSREEALNALSISESQLEALFQLVDTNSLNLEKLEKASKSDSPLTIFSGNDFIPEVIVPTNKLPKIVDVFVQFINAYYEDDLNEDMRHHVMKKVREQKLDTRRLTRVVKEGIIGDSYFLFFSQLFYNIMLSVMEKIVQQNFQNKEIYNQCFIAFWLSRLSVNERVILVEKKRGEEAVDGHYLSIVKGLITRTTLKRGSKVYEPFSISMLLEIESETFEADTGQKSVRLSELYSQENLSDLIRKKNYSGQPIENILIFSSSNVKYYCHRVRLISSFFSVLAEERERVERTIHEDWKQDVKKITSKDKEHEFFELLETRYIGAFFKNYLNLVLKVIHSSPSGGKKIDYAYLIQRLFFTENDKLFISVDTQDLLYKSEDLDKKKHVLEKFCDVLIDNKTGKDRKAYEILDLSFPVIRRAAIKESKINFFNRIIFNIKELFSAMILFFEGDKGYLSFLARRYYSFKKTDSKQAKSKKGGKKSSTFAPSMQSNSMFSSDSMQDSGLSKSDPTSRKQANKKAALKMLLQKLPDLKNPTRMKELIEREHDAWNIKIGEVRKELRQTIDEKIMKLTERFDPSAFVEDNMDMFYQKISSGNKLEGVEYSDALKRYIFYKASLIHYQKLKK